MISVFCVYNSKQKLEEILLSSLEKQNIQFEFFPINNIGNKISSIAGAFNDAAGKMGRGKYLMFVHQDVELISPTWLRDVEKVLDSIVDLGMAGVAGARKEGGKKPKEHLVGHIIDGNGVWGTPISAPIRVQTLDELLIIIPRKVFEVQKFDSKTFDFIHFFGIDYGLSLAKEGLGTYVIPGVVNHKSVGTTTKILRYSLRIYIKHFHDCPIYTTFNVVSGYQILRESILSLLPSGLRAVMRNIKKKIKIL